MIFITGFKSQLNKICRLKTTMYSIKKSLVNREIVKLFFIQYLQDNLASLSDFLH